MCLRLIELSISLCLKLDNQICKILSFRTIRNLKRDPILELILNILSLLHQKEETLRQENHLVFQDPETRLEEKEAIQLLIKEKNRSIQLMLQSLRTFLMKLQVVLTLRWQMLNLMLKLDLQLTINQFRLQRDNKVQELNSRSQQLHSQHSYLLIN